MVPNPKINAAIARYIQRISIEPLPFVCVRSGLLHDRKTIKKEGRSHAMGLKRVFKKIWSSIVLAAVPIANPIPKRSCIEGLKRQLSLCQIHEPEATWIATMKVNRLELERGTPLCQIQKKKIRKKKLDSIDMRGMAGRLTGQLRECADNGTNQIYPFCDAVQWLRCRPSNATQLMS